MHLVNEKPTPSPAALLAEWIREENLTQREAADLLQLKAPELSMILSNRRPISERIAKSLSIALAHKHKGWSADKWLNLQREFTESLRAAEEPAASPEPFTQTDRVGVLCDADICEMVGRGILRIDPFSEDLVQPASYDLTAGSLTWFDQDQRGRRRHVKLSKDGTTAMDPGESALFFAKQTLHIPVNMTARLAAAGYLVENGVVCAFGIQMEPGWVGQPYFSLFHQGDEKLEISADDRCVSVEFQFLQRLPKKPWGVALRPERKTGERGVTTLQEGSGSTVSVEPAQNVSRQT